MITTAEGTAALDESMTTPRTSAVAVWPGSVAGKKPARASHRIRVLWRVSIVRLLYRRFALQAWSCGRKPRAACTLLKWVPSADGVITFSDGKNVGHALAGLLAGGYHWTEAQVKHR
jgi:hypothetical protein